MISGITKALSIDYHPKLIEILIVSTLSGVLSANIIAPLMVAFILHDAVPHLLIYSWLSLHFMLFVGRVFMSKKLDYFLKIKSDKAIKSLKITFVLTASTALLYTIAAWSSVLYDVPDIRVLMIGTIMMALVAGSVSTLVSIFHAFVLYLFINVLPLIAAMIYHGGEMFHIFALVLSIFSLTIFVAGYRQFLTLKNSITLEVKQERSLKEIEHLNKSLI
ncbi:MAG: hypothetical protein DRG24_00755, partial [Epsilonproteobacteria bacterium]